MKLIPQSLLGRSAWILGIGFILLIADAILLTGAILQSAASSQNLLAVAARIRTTTSILANAPAEERSTIAIYAADDLLDIHYSQQGRQIPANKPDWKSRGLDRHLEKFFENIPVSQLIVSHPDQFSGPGANLNHVTVDVQLQDGSWIHYRSSTAHRHKQWIASMVVVFLCFIATIYFLAYLISRQVVKPLQQFSKAALSFSTDINSAPLQIEGPAEIRQASDVFNTMQQRIRRFVNERMQILAAISHDLRTPLTRIRLRMEAQSSDSARDKNLNDIREMQAMLDTTLAFARDDAAQEQKTATDLGALLQSLCDDLQDNGLDARYHGPLPIPYHCRPIALRRAFCNLVENACQYGKQATVSIEQQARQLKVHIKDQGPGISEAEWENVFTPFYRLEKSRNRETGGTGLGLSVARTIIQGHGGSIILKNILEPQDQKASMRQVAGLWLCVMLPLDDDQSR